jgi:threonine dehydrogenase-like Zn-dependent dehydrogenase
MKAACWHGAGDIRVEHVPDPVRLNPRDAILRVSVSGICGSDLHVFNGHVPTVVQGDILGHEFCGEVVEVGPQVPELRPGDRVVVPSIIACGGCFHCQREEWALCDNSNPNARLAERMFGFAGAGMFGYTHLFGGYAGSDAQYIRVPFADVGAAVIPHAVSDEQALFASDTLPTGMMAAEMCGIRPGDTVAVWGAGPVGQCAMLSAYLLGAERVIAIDRIPSRLEMARRYAWAEPLNYEHVDIQAALTDLTAGRGPDACIDAVGLEAHAFGVEGIYDRAKQALWLETDRPSALRHAIMACRKGGTVVIVGVYAGLSDKIPIGAAMNKGLTLRMGLQHGHRYLRGLLEAMAGGRMDPSYLITHRLPLERAQDAFRLCQDKADECLKVLLTAA